MVITLFSKKVNNPKGKYYYEIILRGYKEKLKNVKKYLGKYLFTFGISFLPEP